MIRTGWLALALVAFVVAPARAQILWQFNESSTATDGNGALLYGWDGRRWSDSPPPPSNPNYTDSRLVGQCPMGGDAVRLSETGHIGQKYVGGDKSVAAPSRGDTRYYRGRTRVTYTDLGSVHTFKHVIVADGGGSNRPILTIGTHVASAHPSCPGNCELTMDLQLDGGSGTISTLAFGVGQWVYWQFSVTSGIGATGNFKLWFMNDNFASPTGTTSGVSWADVEIANQGVMGTGYYLNDSIDASDNFKIDICDLEMSTSFNNAWTTGGGGGGGGEPTTVRVRSLRRATP